MRVDFTKMQGAGNDFVVLDKRVRPLGLTSTQLAVLVDRRFGASCDQLILLQPAREPEADAFVRFYNIDAHGGDLGNSKGLLVRKVAGSSSAKGIPLRTG